MNVDRFIRLIGTYGADPGRWPDSERDEALRLAETAPEARAAWEKAQRLDSLFLADRPAIDPARENAILAAALRQIRASAPRREIGWRFLFAPMPSAAFATMLAAGIAIGFALSSPDAPPAQGGLMALLDYPGGGVEGLIQ